MRMTSGQAELSVDLHCGGRLSSLRVNGLELLVTQAERSIDWGAYPMAPWAGRVRGGRFPWAGAVQQLPINAPPHALHGTVFDAEWIQTGPNSLRCALGEHWPWAGEARSVLQLSDRALEWRLEVHAKEEPFPVVLGWHPWFRRRLDSGEPLRLHVDAAEMYVRDRAGIPTGELREPTQGPWDDCFRGLREAPELDWPGVVKLKIESSCDHWVVYSEPEHAVCVEPQSGPPDAFNLGGAEWAKPGRPVVHTLRVAWELP